MCFPGRKAHTERDKKERDKKETSNREQAQVALGSTPGSMGHPESELAWKRGQRQQGVRMGAADQHSFGPAPLCELPAVSPGSRIGRQVQAVPGSRGRGRISVFFFVFCFAF